MIYRGYVDVESEARMSAVNVSSAIHVGQTEGEIIIRLTRPAMLIGNPAVVNIILSKGAAAAQGRPILFERAFVWRSTQPIGVDGVNQTTRRALDIRGVEQTRRNRRHRPLVDGQRLIDREPGWAIGGIDHESPGCKSMGAIAIIGGDRDRGTGKHIGCRAQGNGAR